VWDVPTSEELYALPGHTGCVNSVVFHPNENVLASASSDKSIYVGELAQ
jgi:Prp8 binding protein